jgi:integrase
LHVCTSPSRCCAGRRRGKLEPGSPPARLDAALVFMTALGTPLHGSTATHRFQHRLRERGLPPRRFRAQRHGAASLVLAKGASMRTVIEQLGHSQISLRMNTYAHIAPELQRENARRMDEALGSIG